MTSQGLLPTMKMLSWILPYKLAEESSGRQVPRLCETRWSSSVIAKYRAVYNALKDISTESSNAEARTQAESFSRLLLSPSFIVALIVAQFVMSFSHPKIIHYDIIKVYQNAKCCRTTMSARGNESKFSEIWKKAEIVAAEVETELCKPRTPRTSRYRSNASTDSTDAVCYYRRNVYYPFIDDCIGEFKSRFPDLTEPMFIGYKLLLSSVSSITLDEVNAIENFYGPDMPNRSLFQSELETWKAECSLVQEMNMDLTAGLKCADRDFFPNSNSMLKLMLTVPVGAVPCERSFLAMRRLKDWRQSTMTENRLCGLALLYTHRDMNIYKDNIVDRFD